MLEIVAIILFCRLVGRTLRPVGVRPVGYQFLTVALWFGGEFIGMFVGLILTGPGRPGYFPVTAYALGILGAFGGAIAAVQLARRRATRETDTTTCRSCGYSRAGIAREAPCPECGAAPPQP